MTTIRRTPKDPKVCAGHKGWHPSTMEECLADLRASQPESSTPCPVCKLPRKDDR